ncbi:MAG: TIGR00180 family glycosyltransferase [Promethearchaeota archaeon]
MTNQNQNCTIIIPTYNRPDRLFRLLSYYESNKVNYEIIIGDSSENEIKKINEKNILKLSNLNFQYVKFSSDLSIFVKALKVLNLVKTKFCVFCADDDFIIPDAIKKCVKFLKKHQDYTAVTGRTINFWTNTLKNNEKTFVWKMKYYHKKIPKSNNFSDSKSRLVFNFAAYTPTFYCVHTTNFLKFLFKEILNSIHGEIFPELLPSMLTSIYGKIKYFKMLYGAREKGQVRHRPIRSTLDFLLDKSYRSKYKRFRERLVVHLSKFTNLDELNARKLIDNSMILYRMRVYPESILHSENKLRFVLSHLKTYLKIFFPEAIFFIYCTIFPRLVHFIKVLNERKFQNTTSKDYIELEKLRKHVLSYSLLL